MKGFNRLISVIVGLTIGLILVGILVSVGDSGASIIKSFFTENNNFLGG